MKKNVFVLGIDDRHLAQLRSLRRADEYRFLELFRREEVKAGPEIPAERILTGARERLAGFDGPIDAVVGYWDFPVSTMLPLLRQPYGLPSASFEAVLKCEHKYWSRLEQTRVVPDNVPRFCAVDPFAEEFRNQITVDYPFWIKPVKSVLSYLGFKVRNDRELDEAIKAIRRAIHRFANPFNYLLQFADLPGEIAEIDGNHCIVESIISRGRQCTLEGYAQRGEIVIYGAIDSIREGTHRSSFARYQYPSSIPRRVLERMAAITRRFLSHIGYDDAPFNIEFYWDDQSGQISLLEVNTRISKSHCPLFKMVDGEYHHQVMLDLATGQVPRFPHRGGMYKLAAKFMWRVFRDAVVRKVPSAEQLEEICRRRPGADVELHISEGMRLSELQYQDSYSYEIAEIFIGGDSQKELRERYEECKAAMGIELEPL
jgi:hypothetical protein